jgi:hypothetical protein
MLLASNSLSSPVTASFLSDDSVRVTPAQQCRSRCSRYGSGPAVTCFLLLAAIDHALVAAPVRSPADQDVESLLWSLKP